MSPTPSGATATDSVVITVGNTAPSATINAPAAGTLWKVGDVITFSGSATDAQDGALPPSALTWDLVLQHCPSNCHAHPLQSYVGVAGGSFVAPDHEVPAYLELRLTATDSGGLTSTVTRRLDPRMVTLTFQTVPGGLSLIVGGTSVEVRLHPHRHRGLHQHGECRLTADQGEQAVHLLRPGPTAALSPTRSSPRLGPLPTRPATSEVHAGR